MGVHILTTFAEAVGALGALLNNDAHYEPLNASYKVWYAVGIATVAATATLMLVWLRGMGQGRREEANPSRLSDLSSIRYLCLGMLILGALISTVGYVVADKAADDHAGETLSPTNRLGADMILGGTVIDLIGSLVIVAGAVCCLLLLRGRSRARVEASADTSTA